MNEWRLITNTEANVEDIFAIPAAVTEGRIASRYILATKVSPGGFLKKFLRIFGIKQPNHQTPKLLPETVIIQKVKRRGILCGAEVVIDQEEAKKQGIEIATLPRTGRGGLQIAQTISLQELMLKSNDHLTALDTPSDEVAAMLYTSGTTGNPKGVMLTHRNFKAECDATVKIIPTTSEDRFASLVPFFHIYGLAIGLVTPIYRGCSSVVIPQYLPKEFLRRLVEDKISIIIGIPTQYHHLLVAARRRQFTTNYLKYCISGAAPLPVSVIDSFKKTFGVDIIEGYGLTETTAAIAVNPAGHTKPGSVGLPVEGAEIKIVDELGNTLPPNQRGEIWVKGEMVMKGYYNQPEATSEVMKEGWFATGDIGYQDDDGFLYITDRKKDIIIKGGFNISPREIEEVILEHPKVKEVAVIGHKDKEGREESIKAFVVLAKNEDMTPEEIIRHCREKLTTYKIPDSVEFIESLPKSATGKVLKKELKADYKDIRLIEQI